MFFLILILNKAYYLKIKVGLIIESRQSLINFAAILETFCELEICNLGRNIGIPSEIRPWTIIIDKFRVSKIDSFSVANLGILSQDLGILSQDLGILSQDLGIFLGH